MSFGLIKDFLATTEEERVEVLYRYLVKGETGSYIAEDFYHNKNYAWKISAITQGYGEIGGKNRGKVNANKGLVKVFVKSYPKGTYANNITFLEWFTSESLEDLNKTDTQDRENTTFLDTEYEVDFSKVDSLLESGPYYQLYQKGGSYTNIELLAFIKTRREDIHQNIYDDFSPFSSDYSKLFSKLSDNQLDYLKKHFNPVEYCKVNNLLIKRSDDEIYLDSIYATSVGAYLNFLKLFIVRHGEAVDITFRWVKKLQHHYINTDLIYLISGYFSYYLDENTSIYSTSIYSTELIENLIENVIKFKETDLRRQALQIYLFFLKITTPNHKLATYLSKVMDKNYHINDDFFLSLFRLAWLTDSQMSNDYYSELLSQYYELEEWADFKLTLTEIEDILSIIFTTNINKS